MSLAAQRQPEPFVVVQFDRRALALIEPEIQLLVMTMHLMRRPSCLMGRSIDRPKLSTYQVIELSEPTRERSILRIYI